MMLPPMTPYTVRPMDPQGAPPYGAPPLGLDMGTVLAMIAAQAGARPPQAYNPGAADPNLPQGAITPASPPLWPPNSVYGQEAGLTGQAAGAPNSWDATAAQGGAQAAGANVQLQALQAAKPNPDDYGWEDYTPPAYPERGTVPIPQRQAPRTDPMASILAALAGFIAPRSAGQFGAAPLQAGIGVANQDYEDALRGYEMRNEQVGQAFADAVAKRGDQVATDQYNRAGEEKASRDLSDAQTEYAKLTAPVAGSAAEGESLANSAGQNSSKTGQAQWAAGMLTVLNNYQNWQTTRSEQAAAAFQESKKTTMALLQHLADQAEKAQDREAQRRYQDAQLRLRGLEIRSNQVTAADNSARGWAAVNDKRRTQLDPMADPRLKPLADALNTARQTLTAAQQRAESRYLILAQNPQFKRANPDGARWQSMNDQALIAAKADFDAASAALERRRQELYPDYKAAEPTTPSGIPGPRPGSNYKPGNGNFLGVIR